MELVDQGHAQATKAGAELKKVSVTGLEKQGDGSFVLKTDDGGTVEAKQVLIASGANLDLARASGLTMRPGTEPRIAEVVATEADGKASVAGIWVAGVAAGSWSVA